MEIAVQRVRLSTGLSDLVAASLGAIVVIAVHLDGRAHLLNLPDSFFTPWHGALYGGVTALFGWLIVIGRVNGKRESASFRMPLGYGLALVGAVVFLAGGVADLAWHTAFGIEFGIDALLSPSHLWLFTAGALMLSGPVRAALAHDTRPTGPRLAAAVLAVTSLAGVAAFALSFLSAYFTDAPTHPTPHFPEGTPEHAAVEIPASLGLASYVVTSLVLAVPLAWLVMRWRLPFGTTTAYATGLAVLATVLLNFHRPYQVVTTAVGGLVVDAFLSIARRRRVPPRVQAVVAAGLLPAVTWTAQLVAMANVEGVHWPAALVSGVVALSTLLAALAGGFLAAPAQASHDAWRPTRDRGQMDWK